MQYQLSKKYRSPTRRNIALAAIGISIVGLVLTFFVMRQGRSPFSSQITRAVSFVTYYPANDWQTDFNHATYANSVLLFTTEQGTIHLSFSEQENPQIFTDISGYYSSLVSKMNEYTTFGTINGSVYLTQPTELHGGQTAVLNNNGTLVFVRPNQNLPTEQWRQLFNTLHVIR